MVACCKHHRQALEQAQERAQERAQEQAQALALEQAQALALEQAQEVVVLPLRKMLNFLRRIQIPYCKQTIKWQAQLVLDL